MASRIILFFLKKGTPKLPTFPDFETEKSLQREALNRNGIKNKIKLKALSQIFHNISFTVHILFLHSLQNPSYDNNVLTE